MRPDDFVLASPTTATAARTGATGSLVQLGRALWRRTAAFAVAVVEAWREARALEANYYRRGGRAPFRE